MRKRWSAGILCVCAGWFADARAMDFPAAHTPTISFAGGSFADSLFEDIPYISMEFLDSVVGASEHWRPESQQLHLRDRQKIDWAFTLDNPFVNINGEVFNLTYPMRRGVNRFYVPLHSLLRLLRSRFGLDLPLPETKPISKNSTSADSAGNITGLEIEHRDNGTLLRIHATQELEWEGLLAEPHYLVKLTGGRLSESCPRKMAGKGLIRSVTAFQEAGLVQITLLLGGRHDSVEVVRENGSPGLTVNVRPLTETAAPKPDPEEPAVSKTPGTIIVDAGHGGHDRGAMVKGVEEATVTLAVAKELKKSLENLGYKVFLTREDDSFKTLPERPQFASAHGGDVFVSLHCNSLSGSVNRHKSISGSTVYILREGESEEDNALARRENQAIQEESGKSGKTEIAPVDWILLEHQLNLYSKQSESLAEAIVKSYEGFDIPKYSTGAHQAGFFVLVGAYMPAVLFEMGFLTNDKDRRILNSASGQKEIAKRMAQAVDRFRRQKP